MQNMTETGLISKKQPATLKRVLSLPLVTFYGLGNILGAGIYVLVGKVVGHAGMYAPLSFVIAALLASLSAFAYAELSARFPFSAGEAVYVQEGIGIQSVSRLVGLLIIMAGVVSAATILRGFTGYLQVFFPVPEVATLLVLVMALWLPLETLAKATSYFLLVVFSLINLSLWRLKKSQPHPAGIIRVPLWVPVSGFFASTLFAGIQLVQDLTAYNIL